MKSLEYKNKIKAENMLRALQRRIIMLMVSVLLTTMAMVMHAYVLPTHYPELGLPLGLFTLLFSIYICVMVVRDDEFRLNGVFDFIFGSKSAKYDLVGGKLDIPFMLSSNVFIGVAAIKWCISLDLKVLITDVAWAPRDLEVAGVVDSTVGNSVHPCTGNVTVYIKALDGAVLRFTDMGPRMFLTEMERMFDADTVRIVKLATSTDYWGMRDEFNDYVDELIANEYMGARIYGF